MGVFICVIFILYVLVLLYQMNLNFLRRSSSAAASNSKPNSQPTTTVPASAASSSSSSSSSVSNDSKNKEIKAMELASEDEFILDGETKKARIGMSRNPLLNSVVVPVIMPPVTIHVKGTPRLQPPYDESLLNSITGYERIVMSKEASLKDHNAQELAEHFSAKLAVYQLIYHQTSATVSKRHRSMGAGGIFRINLDKDPFVDDCMFDMVMCYFWRMGRTLASTQKEKETKIKTTENGLLFCYGHIYDIPPLSPTSNAPIPRSTPPGELPQREHWLEYAQDTIQTCRPNSNISKGLLSLTAFVINVTFALLMSIRERFWHWGTTKESQFMLSSYSPANKNKKRKVATTTDESDLRSKVYLIPGHEQLWNILRERWDVNHLHKTSDLWLQKHGMTYNPFAGDVIERWYASVREEEQKNRQSSKNSTKILSTSYRQQQQRFKPDATKKKIEFGTRSLVGKQSNLMHEVPKWINPDKTSKQLRKRDSVYLPMFYSHPFAVHILGDLTLDWTELNYRLALSFFRLPGENDHAPTTETKERLISQLFEAVQSITSMTNRIKPKQDDNDGENEERPLKRLRSSKEASEDQIRTLLNGWMQSLCHILYTSPAKFSGYLFDSGLSASAPFSARKRNRFQNQIKQEHTKKAEMDALLHPRSSTTEKSESKKGEEEESESETEVQEETEKEKEKPVLHVSKTRPLGYVRQKIQTALTQLNMDSHVSLRKPIWDHPYLFRCYRLLPMGDWTHSSQQEQHQLVYDNPSDVEWADLEHTKVNGLVSAAAAASSPLMEYKKESITKTLQEDHMEIKHKAEKTLRAFYDDPKLIHQLKEAFDSDPLKFVCDSNNKPRIRLTLSSSSSSSSSGSEQINVIDSLFYDWIQFQCSHLAGATSSAASLELLTQFLSVQQKHDREQSCVSCFR